MPLEDEEIPRPCCGPLGGAIIDLSEKAVWDLKDLSDRKFRMAFSDRGFRMDFLDRRFRMNFWCSSSRSRM